MTDSIITKQELIDAKPDAKSLGEAANGNQTGIVVPRYGEPYLTAPAAIKKIIEAGDVVPFPTTELLLAWTPDTAPRAAKALDTNKVYFWGKLSESETVDTWHDVGWSDYIRSKEYTDEKVITEENSNDEIAFAVIDENGKRTWLESGKDGKPTDYSIELIKEKIAASETNIATALRNHLDQNIVISSGPNIVCWGDSMTAGAGSDGNPYTKYLQNLLISYGSDAVVYNCGVGGETSVTIAARQGGNPFSVTVTSGSIAASASVDNPITFNALSGVIPTPLLQGSGNPFEDVGYLKGVLNGVAGAIHGAAGNTYVFRRDESGSVVTTNRPTLFFTDYSKELRSDIAIFWVGQNNSSVGNDARAIPDVKAMIQHLQAADKRYLVINKPISTPEEDKIWYAEFGNRYIAARAYMIEFGMQDAGLTPTQEDIDSMNAGYIANSLRYDNVHWKAPGYEILANLIFKRLKDLEWI